MIASLSSDGRAAVCPFVLPSQFEPEQILPPRHCKWADEARYLLSTVTHKTTTRSVDDRGYARLNSQILREIIHPRRFRVIVESLQGSGFVEVDSSYCPGKYPKGYRLGPACKDARPIYVQPTCSRLIAKLQRVQERTTAEQESRRLPIHAQLNELQHRHLTVCLWQAESLLPLLDASARFGQRVLIRQLVEERMTNSVGSTGRWFNGLTNISRQLRPALRIAGQPLTAIDLTSCQPALLGLLAKHHATAFRRKTGTTYKVEAGPLSPLCLPCEAAACFCSLDARCELERFVELACSGDLYCRLAGLADISRALAKKEFLVGILAPRRIYPSRVRSVMDREFPAVLQFIREINHTNHGNLIRNLQQLEAWLVIETVAPKLVNRCPIVPLHDAIYCCPADLPLVRAAFEDAFDEIGYRIGMKEEFVPQRTGLAA